MKNYTVLWSNTGGVNHPERFFPNGKARGMEGDGADDETDPELWQLNQTSPHDCPISTTCAS